MGLVTCTTIALEDEAITKTKLNGLAGNLISEFNGNIENSNIKSTAGIVDTKLAQITTANKVSVTALGEYVSYEDDFVFWEDDLVYYN
jgi:hypothetical protein